MEMESINVLARNSTCVSELFLGFNNDLLDMTELCSQLAQCPGFCENALETGNLDLAGKGIYISTVIQGTLAVSIGAILPLLIYLTRTFPIRPLVPRIPLLQDMNHEIHKINLFFTLCLLISVTLESARTSRPVLETTFLSSFVDLEVSINSIFYWGMIVDEQINSNPLVGTFFAYAAMTCAEWYLTSRVSIPHHSFHKMLAHGCRTQPTEAVGLTLSLDSNLNTTQGLDIKLDLGDEVSAKQAFLWILHLCLVCGVVFALLVRIKNKLPGWLRTHGKATGWASLLTLLSRNFFYHTGNSGCLAQLVRMMRGKDLPPLTDWDFGQTTALMIWLPVVWALLTVIRKWRTPTIATSENGIAVTDDRQLELGSEKRGKLPNMEHDQPCQEV